MRRAWYKFSRNKLSVAGLTVVSLVIIVALAAPLVAPHPEHAGAFVDYGHAGTPPGAKYWLGSDQFGRDILSRIFFAFRGALIMGIGVLAVVVPVGVLLGLVAGYFKDTWIETLIMRTTDIFLALPPLILALAVCAVLRPTLFNSMMAVSLAWWPWYTRLVYGMSSSLRNEFYTQAAELTGAGRWHILLREILPNCLAPIFTKMTLDMGWVILIGSSLSFVGMGEQPPKPALGTMVADGAKYLPHQWWIAVFPAVAIMVIVLAFNLLGDGVRDMLSTEEA
ncbi:MAG TPA: ABC transporter permease [Firmicutes bacterium]|nr:ABC transporter permease [Bacillota bacterium]